MSYAWNTQKAIDHTHRSSKLVLWAHEMGYYLVRGEAQRMESRQIEIYGYARKSYHLYCRADDFTLFIKENDKFIYIDDGEHEAWKAIADKAEELGMRSGRNWEDIRHVETE